MNSLPQWILVLIGLGGGLFLIFLFNPPHSKCDSQFELFKKHQTPFLFLDPQKPNMTKTQLEKSMEECRKSNNSGGCYPFFEGVQKMVNDLKIITGDCGDDVKSRSEVQSAVWKSMTFIFELAWGTKPPKSQYENISWFDHLNIAIYCDLRTYIMNNYNKEKWEDFRENILTSLPGSTDLGRDKTWKLSLFTVSCK